MKNVEIIRQRIVRGQSTEIQRLRSFVSMADSSAHEAIAALQGESAQALLAELTELILARLGHVTVVVADDPLARSKTQRVVSKVLGRPNGARGKPGE